jgi:epoxyqueuosine reductase
MDRPEQLRSRIAALGFDEVRFAAAGPVPADALRGWIAAGNQADMAWIDRTAAKRLTPELVLPGVRSIIALGVNYWDAGAADPGRPVFARYALYSDYHDTIKRGLEQAGRILEELWGAGPSDYRAYVDTGPVLEREWAARSGIGFVGKNAMLISRRHGNALLLAAILTRVELPPDPPLAKAEGRRGGVGLLCGKCTRCLDACPTRAFPAPGVVDARLCISYQTIENRGFIPRELRPGIGTRVFGCDVCIEVCPWNRFAAAGRRMLLSARPGLNALSWAELLDMTPASFSAHFRGTAVKRLKFAGFMRNVCIAAGNTGDRSLLSGLLRLAAHELPLIRAHAVWAVHRLAGDSAPKLLSQARAAETDSAVLEEYGLDDNFAGAGSLP